MDLATAIEECLDGLRVLARSALASERPNHTLQTMALVNEFWLSLQKRTDLSFPSREAFLAYARTAIRNILIDYGRKRRATRRGGGLTMSMDPADLVGLAVVIPKHEEAIWVANLLERQNFSDSVTARVAELRYLGGMSTNAVAQVLGLSEEQARRHWRAARAWLASEIAHEAQADHAHG